MGKGPGMKKSLLVVCISVFAVAAVAADGIPVRNASGPDQDGRSLLLTGTTLFGFGYWGLALTQALDIEDSSRAIGVYLLTAGSSFFVPYFLTKESPVTKGMSVMAINGGLKGNLDALLLYYVVKNGDSGSDQALYASSLLGSIAELILFYKIAEKYNYSPGKANLLSTVSAFGYLYGFLGVMTLSDTPSERAIAASMLASGLSAYFAVNHIFKTETYGDGDYVMPTITGYLAGLVPLCVMAAMDETPEGKGLAGLSLASSVLGLWLGDRLVRDINMSSSQGNYIHLGTLGGALAALGLVFALGGDSDATYRWLPLMTVAGGAGGMAIIYSTFKNRIVKKGRTAFHLNVNPGALVTGFRERSFSGSGDSMLSRMPVVSAGLAF